MTCDVGLGRLRLERAQRLNHAVATKIKHRIHQVEPGRLERGLQAAPRRSPDLRAFSHKAELAISRATRVPADAEATLPNRINAVMTSPRSHFTQASIAMRARKQAPLGCRRPNLA